jgi:prophage regulatory protein
MEPIKPVRLIRLPEVVDRTGQSAAKVYDAMADGKFPKSVATGPNSRAWVEHEVDEWIRARIDARDKQTDGEWRVMNPHIGKGRPRKPLAPSARPGTSQIMGPTQAAPPPMGRKKHAPTSETDARDGGSDADLRAINRNIGKGRSRRPQQEAA